MLRNFPKFGFACFFVAALVPTQAVAGIIAVNINGGGWNAFGLAGNFNTNGNTNCGIGGNCAEISGFGANNINGTGIDVNGTAAFTTVDVGGVTQSALISATMTVDNTNAGCVGFPCATTNVLVAFISDEFDASAAGPAGVAVSGLFINDGGGNGNNVTADSQGQMNYLTGGVFNAAFPGSFSLTTPLVSFAGAGPIGYWQYAVSGSLGGITQLIGVAGSDVAGNSEVTFPVTVEDDDSAALGPEPGSWLLLGGGLTAAGIIRRRRSA